MFYISRQMSVQVSNYARTRKLSAHAWTAVHTLTHTSIDQQDYSQRWWQKAVPVNRVNEVFI